MSSQLSVEQQSGGDHPVLQRGESHNSINSISSQESREHKIPRTSNRCHFQKLSPVSLEFHIHSKINSHKTLPSLYICSRGTTGRKAIPVVVDQMCSSTGAYTDNRQHCIFSGHE